MSRAASPFSAKTVLLVLLVGALAFLLLLYAMAKGWDGRDGNDGGAHAASPGLNGYAGLVSLLDARGYSPSLSRNPAELDDEDALLVLTPQLWTDSEEVWEIIERRRYLGPTLVILPKWIAIPAQPGLNVEARPGWVHLYQAQETDWSSETDGPGDFKTEIDEQAGWSGLGLTGTLPASKNVKALTANNVRAMVLTPSGGVLAGYWEDGGYYPDLALSVGIDAPEGSGPEDGKWPVTFVAEPDLMNNYGLADEQRAKLALALIDASFDGYDLPVVFDLTLPGLARSENLLSMAFTPPFLAATLCLILAAIVIAWRAFRRFGPPIADAPAFAMGKRRLVRNGAQLVERSRRWHLLGPPYAAMVIARIAGRLGIREHDPAMREAAIAQALHERGQDDLELSAKAEALRRADRPGELLRAAQAMKRIEEAI